MGPAIIFPIAQGPRRKLQEAQGGTAQVHDGLRQRGHDGAVVPCRRTARGR
jgi:hypothetical protein